MKITVCSLYRNKNRLVLCGSDETENGLFVFNGQSINLQMPYEEPGLRKALGECLASAKHSVPLPDFTMVRNNLLRALGVSDLSKLAQSYDLVKVRRFGAVIVFCPTRKFVRGSFKPISEHEIEMPWEGSHLRDAAEIAFAHCQE